MPSVSKAVRTNSRIACVITPRPPEAGSPKAYQIIAILSTPSQSARHSGGPHQKESIALVAHSHSDQRGIDNAVPPLASQPLIDFGFREPPGDGGKVLWRQRLDADQDTSPAVKAS